MVRLRLFDLSILEPTVISNAFPFHNGSIETTLDSDLGTEMEWEISIPQWFDWDNTRRFIDLTVFLVFPFHYGSIETGRGG